MKSRGLAIDNATSPLKTFEFERRDIGSHDVGLDVKELLVIEYYSRR